MSTTNGASIDTSNQAIASAAGNDSNSDGLTSKTFKFLTFALIGVLVLFVADVSEIRNGSEMDTTIVKEGHDEAGTLVTGLPSEVARSEVVPKGSDTEDDGTNIGSTPSWTYQSQQQDNNIGRWTYKTRSQPYTDEEKAAMAAQFGAWNWADEKERPKEDFYKEYPNRDVPRDKFPSNAWQLDEEYLARFLQEAQDLVMRGMEAILSEYGHGSDDDNSSFEERMTMFKLEIQPENVTNDEQRRQLKKGFAPTRGGWTTEKSWAGLKRRLLHSIMTEDTFVFAMGGHSAAAGHGNHFQQSYTLQVAWVLEPVFARLGVKHQSRNFGMGGLGTAQSGIAAPSIYGPDVDVLMWDSSMTEPSTRVGDLMARQAIMGGIKVPVLWSFRKQVLDLIHKHGDADVGTVGNPFFDLDLATTQSDLESIAWAQRYMRCAPEIKAICKKYEYDGSCWIKRPDYTPKTKQDAVMGSRVSWHPGNKSHRLQGRVIAFTILKALHEVFVSWSEKDGYIMEDDEWHVTDYYENIRNKVTNIAPENSPCYRLDNVQSEGKKKISVYSKLCDFPMKGRTEFTPRAYPDHTSLRTIMPAEMLAELNQPPPTVYMPPDVLNPSLHPPKGEVDVLAILENGNSFREIMAPSYLEYYDSETSFTDLLEKPGKGNLLEASAGFCDGTLDSWCNKDKEQSCLLSGQNDGRRGIKFDHLSGWLLFNLPKVKHGFIVMKYDSWRIGNPRTRSWKTVNGERRHLLESNYTTQELTLRKRSLKNKADTSKVCNKFRLEYSIDGNITSLTWKEFQDQQVVLQRVVELITLLDDQSYTGGEEKDVQLGLRLQGCKLFEVTHLYWA